jgi:Kef-type K+ transport system membrane component KefB
MMALPFAFLLAVDGAALKIPLAMLLVLGAATLFSELFERLHQPGIVGQILAGALIGPSVLGWVRPDSFLTALADLGVMFLLFRVGLEVKSSDLMKVGGTASAVAVLGVVFPFLMGWGILLAWGAPQKEAVFVGAAMVATSVGITAQVLSSKKLLHLRASQIILTAAVIDDVLGLLVLAAVSGIARDRVRVAELATTAALAVGFTAIVAVWGTRAVTRLASRIEGKLRGAEGEFALAMCLLFSLSALAVYVGVAAIIGAFLAGMVLAESAQPRVRDLTDGVSELLTPFFLVGIGLHFNPAALTHGPTMLLAGTILAAAVVSKFLGCGLGAIRLGRTDMVRIGVGMIPRGEVGMVVAQIGMGMGIMAQHVYDVVVVMSIATTLVAPPLLSLAYKRASYETGDSSPA